MKQICRGLSFVPIFEKEPQAKTVKAKGEISLTMESQRFLKINEATGLKDMVKRKKTSVVQTVDHRPVFVLGCGKGQ